LSNESPERTALQACAENAVGTRGLVTVRQRSRATLEQRYTDIFDRTGQRCSLGEYQGYSLYVGAAIPAGSKEARERLLRYCLRPSLSLERLSLDRNGQVVYQVKATRRGKATQRIMDPVSFMARLAALVPPPRRALLRYYGVFGTWPHFAVGAGDPQGHCIPETRRGSLRMPRMPEGWLGLCGAGLRDVRPRLPPGERPASVFAASSRCIARLGPW
jgi:hypothetical protein